MPSKEIIWSEKKLLKAVLLKAVLATIAILSVFVILDFLSYNLPSRLIPVLVLFAGLVLVAVLFVAYQKPPWLSSLKSYPKQVAFIAIQGLLLVFFAIEVFQVFNINFENKTFEFSPEPLPYALMGIIVLVLFIINFSLKKKNAFTYSNQQDAKFVVRETTRIKALRAKENPFSVVLFAFELLYALIIAYAISYYLDPARQLAYWAKFGGILGIEVSPWLPMLFHVIGFIVLTAVLLWLNDYARKFDSLKFKGRKGFKKLREKNRKSKK